MTSVESHITGCVGAGNMGGAIVAGLSEKIGASAVAFHDVDEAKAKLLKEKTGARFCATAAELCEISDSVILAVKPDVVGRLVKELAPKLKGKIILSIAAGVSISSIEEAAGAGSHVVRVMPNTPALVGEGMTVLAPGNDVSVEMLDRAEKIFAAVGKTMILPEKLMDAVTAVSGCGPAYAFTVIQAMADGAVKLGVPRDRAVVLAAQTLSGAAKMVLETGAEPMALRGMVTSPGGSTIEAVHCLERAGFSGILMDAVEAAAKKSEILGGRKK